MAVPTWTLLTANKGNTASAFVTASITPTADRILRVGVWALTPSAPVSAVPTLTGGGVATWSEVTGSTVVHQNRRMTWFRALTGGSPTSGAITIDFAGVSQEGCRWIVLEESGSLQTGTNGADADAQTATYENGSANTFTTTFGSAWGGDDHRALSYAFKGAVGAVLTPGTGFSELANVSGTGGTVFALYGRDGSSLDVDGTFDGGPGRLMASSIEVVGVDDTPISPVSFPYPRVRRIGLNGRLN